MASINLPFATYEERQNAITRAYDLQEQKVGSVSVDIRYDGLWIEGVAVRHIGFWEPQDEEGTCAVIDMDESLLSAEQVRLIAGALPLGYEVFSTRHSNGSDRLRLLRHEVSGCHMIPREFIPARDQSRWDAEYDQHQMGLLHGYSTFRWQQPHVELEGQEPDITVDMRFIDQRCPIRVGRKFGIQYGEKQTAWQWRSLGFEREDWDQMQKVSWDCLRTDLDEPGCVWLSVLRMADANYLPGVVMPSKVSYPPFARNIRRRRGDWNILGSSTGAAVEKLFASTRTETVQRATKGRALQWGEADHTTADFPWPTTDTTPAGRSEETPRYPVLGVRPDATGFNRYRPDRVWNHFRGYQRNALNWGGDRVFIHRGLDKWRFLFAFEDVLRSYDDSFALLYCIPITVEHADAKTHVTKTHRGMPLDLQEAIWAVPGMSMALAHAQNMVRFQLTKRVPLSSSYQEALPKTHFMAVLGAGSSAAAKNLWGAETCETPYDQYRGEAPSIVSLLWQLFGSAGRATLVQPVAKSKPLVRGLSMDCIEGDYEAPSPTLLRRLDL